MFGGQPNHGRQLCFPLYLHASGSDFRFYDGSDLKTFLLMRLQEPDASAVCRPTGVYLLDFFCSVIQFFTVESSSMLYLCFISFFFLIYMFWEMMH